MPCNRTFRLYTCSFYSCVLKQSQQWDGFDNTHSCKKRKQSLVNSLKRIKHSRLSNLLITIILFYLLYVVCREYCTTYFDVHQTTIGITGEALHHIENACENWCGSPGARTALYEFRDNIDAIKQNATDQHANHSENDTNGTGNNESDTT